ncbi:MAG: hypothetical protein LBN27_10100 [Prevotellaceae bacterium]|jgi:hypothetical protein|nr:hypothetical protein [Prevotellaceae bacterium]
MRKKLLRKSAFLLLLSGAMLSSCIDKDYDFDNLDSETALKDVSFGIPFGTIKYSVTEIANKANFNVVVEGDTLFLLYNKALNFGADPGLQTETQTINVFDDIIDDYGDGSVLYFSNPIFNCVVKNDGDTQAKLRINYVRGIRGTRDTVAIFNNGKDSITMLIPGKQTTTTRFDRENGETDRIFKIGQYPYVGPNQTEYQFQLTTPSNDSIHIDMRAKLPMTFDKDSRLVYKDTLPINLAASNTISDNIEQVVIRLNYTNKLPVGGVINVIFLDENDAPIALNERIFTLDKMDLTNIRIQNFNAGIATGEKEGKMYITFDKAEWAAAKDIKSVVLKTVLTNPDENIHFRPDNFLELKVDLYLKGNIKL